MRGDSGRCEWVTVGVRWSFARGRTCQATGWRGPVRACSGQPCGVEAGARLVGTIVGPGVRVGRGAALRGAVLGEGAEVPPDHHGHDVNPDAGRTPCD